MKPLFGLTGIIGGCAASMLVSQAAVAASTAITAVEVNPTDAGLQITLETSNGDRPQIFTVNRGNSLVADIVNAELVLPGGNNYLENDPAPGISSIALTQLDANSVRLTVTGTGEAPTGQVNQDNGLIVFSLGSAGTSANADGAPPPLPDSVVENDVEVAQDPLPSDEDVLIPDPEVRIEGQRVTRQEVRPNVPPTQPRAVPPPVGDVAASILDATPSNIVLGTREVIPRLVLRDASAREVLALLARAAGLNLAYVPPTDEEGRPIPTEDVIEARVSLDIENEPIEDVFNYVLQVTGLEANRLGRTIFVGRRLPDEARDTTAVTFRLNQAQATNAATYLATLGAETRQFIEGRLARTTERDPETGIINTVETFQEPQVVTVEVDPGTSPVLLRGLSVTSDPRLNTVTLVGSPRSVQIAANLLTQLDARVRQVAVSVRVIDVDLDAIERASSSFSFGIGDTRVINSNGVGLINFSQDSPAETELSPTTIGNDVIGDFDFVENEEFQAVADAVEEGLISPEALPPILEVITENYDFPDQGAFDFSNAFLAQLQLAVTSGSAKILTDPTLLVQEGQTAEVVLADQVITNVEIESEGTGDERTQTVTVITEPAGVTLAVQVDRIDDNGFVTLSVNPSVSAPAGTQEIEVEDAVTTLTLLSERRLSSGTLRIRDGQTLILSGIIQDTDRVSIQKWPILGDLPIIGALFRRTERTNERREVIIVMTANILDDSEFSNYGYSYNGLSPESQDLLRQP